MQVPGFLLELTEGFGLGTLRGNSTRVMGIPAARWSPMNDPVVLTFAFRNEFTPNFNPLNTVLL
jgi:hypothetical protein